MHLPSSPEIFTRSRASRKRRKIGIRHYTQNSLIMINSKKLLKHYPALEEIRGVYQHLANNLQIAIGSAEEF